MSEQLCEIGVFGLGVMGRNLALNMAEHGFQTAVFNRTTAKTEKFMQQYGKDFPVKGATQLEEFVSYLKKPRAILIMVKAGPAVDAVIAELLPYLEPDDVLIDGGNSHFMDTERRHKELHEQGIYFIGMGVSGGEAGARYGPSLMPGGSKEGYERVRPVLEAIAAKVNGDPCVTYLGPGGAGHYVKMVHNGIEYSYIQLIAETYDLMKRGLGMSNVELSEMYERWNRAELNSFLMEITANIFKAKDEETGNYLIDMILDVARQKGTGRWTAQNAMDLMVPVPNVDLAVVQRNLSMYKEERLRLERILGAPKRQIPENGRLFANEIRRALYTGLILSFDQGFALLRKASEEYNYNLPLADIAAIWRGGCIIRSALLGDIRSALTSEPGLSHLMAHKTFTQRILEREKALRHVVSAAVQVGIPVPGLSGALAYLDSYRSGWLPANLIQAQRDYFGAHTYERIDRPGTFHTEWAKLLTEGR